MTLRKIIGIVHLWLGLTSGLVVFVSMSAAAIFVWDEELTHWYYRDYVFVEPRTSPQQPLSALTETARRAVPGKAIEGVEITNDPARAYVFSTYKSNEKPTGWTHWADYAYWDKIYVDPYTGKVLGRVDMLTNWIDLTRRLHQNLLLRYDIGHYIVGFATLFVMVLSLTGLVLWFPKNKAAFKQRFSIKWNARWRRVNYDVHNVGGFYTNLLILLLATTGLVWTFDWWTNGIYRLLGDDPKRVFPKHDPPAVTGPFLLKPIDKALADVVTKRPAWTSIGLYLPATTDQKEAEIAAYVRFNTGSGWDEWDSYYYHPSTGDLFHQDRQEDKTLGATWRNSNYAIHVGSIYGLPTKLLASLVALFLASLPVTGFLIWWGRRKKAAKAVMRRAALMNQDYSAD